MDNIHVDRFFSKVDKIPGGCWVWKGGKFGNGYGRFSIKHKYYPAHRVSYEHAYGPIPTGLDLHHKCRNILCVNPAHTEPVTRRVNLLLGQTLTAKHAQATHCPQGHPYNEQNTYIYRGLRYCRKCRDHHRARNREKQKGGER